MHHKENIRICSSSKKKPLRECLMSWAQLLVGPWWEVPPSPAQPSPPVPRWLHSSVLEPDCSWLPMGPDAAPMPGSLWPAAGHPDTAQAAILLSWLFTQHWFHEGTACLLQDRQPTIMDCPLPVRLVLVGRGSADFFGQANSLDHHTLSHSSWAEELIALRSGLDRQGEQCQHFPADTRHCLPLPAK